MVFLLFDRVSRTGVTVALKGGRADRGDRLKSARILVSRALKCLGGPLSRARRARSLRYGLVYQHPSPSGPVPVQHRLRMPVREHLDVGDERARGFRPDPAGEVVRDLVHLARRSGVGTPARSHPQSRHGLVAMDPTDTSADQQHAAQDAGQCATRGEVGGRESQREQRE